MEDPDAELTLKLLKLTPQENELTVVRSDSEFMKDYNSTAKQQSSASQIIISTEDSENVSATDPPTLEQACKRLGKDQGFVFVPT